MLIVSMILLTNKNELKFECIFFFIFRPFLITLFFKLDTAKNLAKDSFAFDIFLNSWIQLTEKPGSTTKKNGFRLIESNCL